MGGVVQIPNGEEEVTTPINGGGNVVITPGGGDGGGEVVELEPNPTEDWAAFIYDDAFDLFPTGYEQNNPLYLSTNSITFTFDAGPTPPMITPCTFAWDFGDGNGGSEIVNMESPAVQKTNSYSTGTYTVNLVVTDAAGDTRSESLYMIVRPTGEEGESIVDYSNHWLEIIGGLEDLMDSAITPGAEGETLSWLARRRVLEGIPFQYLVPTEDALPPETIRFFHIDRNWLDALIDGCLSVALTTSRERKWLLEEREDPWTSAQQGPHPIPSQVSDMCFEDFDINGDGVLNVLDVVGWINAGETQGSPIIDTLQQIILGTIPTPPPRPAPTITNYEYIMRKLNSLEMWNRGMFYNALYNRNQGNQNDFTTGGRLTGMLFRSTIVRDFPGLEISAFAHDGTGSAWVAGNLVQIIRMERLSESIMLCIFNGLPTHLRIKEPSEGIRMGVDGALDGSPHPYRLKMKMPDGTLFEPQPPAANSPNPSVDVDVRASSTNDVLDIRRIYDSLLSDATVQPQIHSQFAADSVSAFFATQFLQFPYQQDFVPLPEIAEVHPDINFPRGVLKK